MIWVIEFFEDGKWISDDRNYLTRKQAREEANDFWHVKTRIRKYIRAE